ncbi:MAG: efflux RND transporter periplasmic adaptor subunit [Ideonella sp.]|nr:efflux RND transporter periplasmic adaptor subunit [Ideonella sp.]
MPRPCLALARRSRAAGLFTTWALLSALAPWARAAEPAASMPAGRPALTVTLTAPQRADWPLRLAGSGGIAAWQEVVVASEVGGWRLVEVAAQVGDVVRRGQLLARLSTDMVNADLAQSRASVAEAKALLAEARANADRARELKPTGVYSLQQTQAILTAEETAKARLLALEARIQSDQVRLAQTRIVAPDDGIISARNALEGAVAQPGQELFRLIRRGRLEWRAEVSAADLSRVKPGMLANLSTPSGQAVKGTVRVVAPTVDAATRNGQVLIDLAPGSDAKPGMFARGEIDVGQASGWTLPQTAVILRDGFSSVMRVGADARVSQLKVTLGRRSGDRVEIVSGLAQDARVVLNGGAFLADGDLVKVVDAAPAVPPKAPAAAASAAGKR